jgi:hypothetical protein
MSGGKGLSIDQCLLNLVDILKHHGPGDEVDEDLPNHTLKTLQSRGIIDSEHKVTKKGSESIKEHIKIHHFIREKTLENLALNNADVMYALMNDDTSEYYELSKSLRIKFRTYGLIERKKIKYGWTIKPSDLWKKIVNQA